MIRDALALARWKVCLLVAAATAAGFALARPGSADGLALVLAGAVLLAAGCSAVNQVQERREDALMERTQNRPLPSGRVSPGQALAFGAGLGLAALLLLWSLSPTCLALGCFVAVVYNGLYTPLKKITSASILVGGLAGAVPPLLGYAAAGGDPTDPPVLAVALVLFLWQVPHFWLLARRYAADYRAAGFAPAPGFAPDGRPRPAFYAWLACLCAAMCLAPAMALPAQAALGLIPAVLALGLAGRIRAIARGDGRGFGQVNAAMVLFLATMALGSLWRGGPFPS